MSARLNLKTRAETAGYTTELGGARRDIDTYLASWRTYGGDWARRTVAVKWSANDARVTGLVVDGQRVSPATRTAAEAAIDALAAAKRGSSLDYVSEGKPRR